MKHKQKQKMIRFWPFESWQSEQAQTWLEGMAQKGWRLDYIGLWAAHFKKAEPAAVRYRCVGRSNLESYEDEKKLREQYNQAGWKYVDYQWHMLVFCDDRIDEAQEVGEVSVDPRRLSKIIRHAFIGQCLKLAALLAVSAIAVYLLSNPWDIINLLLHKNIFLLSAVSFIFLAAYRIIQKAVRLISVRYRAQNENSDEQQKRMDCLSRQEGKYRISLLILAVLAVLAWVFPLHLFDTILPKEPFTLTISDILPESSSQEASIIDTPVDDGGFSLLFPKQHVMWQHEKDKNGTSVLKCESLHALMPCVAQLQAEQTAEILFFQEERFGSESYGFDRFWSYSSTTLSGVLAVKGCEVYYIEYWNEISPDKLAAALLDKINKASK